MRLFPVVQVIEQESSDRTDWDLAFAYEEKEEKYKPKTGEEAAADLDKYVDERPGADVGVNWVAEHTLLTKYRDTLESLVKVSLRPLLYTVYPVRFASHDGDLTLLLASLGSVNVYNTLRLEAKERAGKELAETVLPELRQFQIVKCPACKYFGVISVYGTKDFSESGSTPKPELVALVASVENCRKLADAEMTEEDFVAASDVYIVDRDEVTDQVRKVKVSLGKE
jgi:hypothetical protein